MTATPPLFHRDPNVFPPIQPDHAQAIGYVVVHWTAVEELIAFVAACLLGIEAREAAHAVTANLTSAGRASLVRSLLAATRRQDWLDDWDEMAPDLLRLQAERNTVVHGEWSVVAPSYWVRRVRSAGQVSWQAGAYSTAKVNALAQDIRTVEDRLWLFTMTIMPDVAQSLRNAVDLPPLVPNQGRKARALHQARAAKQAGRDADRLRSAKSAERKAVVPKT